MDLETVRWKLADDLTPQEVDFLVENKDKLNEEELAAFSEVILQSTPLGDPDAIIDEAIDKAVEEPENTDPANVIPEAAAPAAPVQPALPAQPAVTVPQTQEQLDAYLEKKRTEWDAAGKTKAEQKTEEAKIQTYFDSGYTPKDWNQYTNDMFEKLAPRFEQRVLETLDKRNKEFQENQEKLKTTQKEIYARFEKEFDTLAESKLIPARTDANFETIKKQILAIGDAHDKSTVADAYKLWSIIPTEHGGGLNVTGAAPVDPKAKITAQKQAAARIQSGRGVVGTGKKGPASWAHIHSTSMDDLLDEARGRTLPA